MASDNKQTNTVPATAVLTNTATAAVTAASAAVAKVDCTAILRAANQYYETAGNGALQLKPYDVPEGQVSGQIAGKIPRVGDIAGCQKR